MKRNITRNDVETELTIIFSSDEIETMLRKEVRKIKDPKKMSLQAIKLFSCYKKDGIGIEYSIDKRGDIVVTLKDTTIGKVRDKFTIEKMDM